MRNLKKGLYPDVGVHGDMHDGHLQMRNIIYLNGVLAVPIEMQVNPEIKAKPELYVILYETDDVKYELADKWQEENFVYFFVKIIK